MKTISCRFCEKWIMANTNLHSRYCINAFICPFSLKLHSSNILKHFNRVILQKRALRFRWKKSEIWVKRYQKMCRPWTHIHRRWSDSNMWDKDISREQAKIPVYVHRTALCLDNGFLEWDISTFDNQIVFRDKLPNIFTVFKKYPTGWEKGLDYTALSPRDPWHSNHGRVNAQC